MWWHSYILVPRRAFETAALDPVINNNLYQDEDGNVHKIPTTQIGATSHKGLTGGWFFNFMTGEIFILLEDVQTRTNTAGPEYPSMPTPQG